MRSLVALAGFCLTVVLSSCGAGDEFPVSDAERRIGAEQHPKLLAEFGGPYAGDESRYLDSLGAKLAASAALEGQCTFTLVNSDVVNAFAVPGCYIYVTRGLMSIVNSEAELASVLAHELGHIAANHSERQQKRSTLRNVGVLAISAITGSERLSRVASAAAGYFTLSYSRKHEYEADDLGLSYLEGAGYDPYAAADMLAALKQNRAFLTQTRSRDEARSIPEWALTHPLTENRIARAWSAANATGHGPDELPEKESEYLKRVDGLLYGDDPTQGFVMGRRFAHPMMRIGFEAPVGFTLTNSPQAILIAGPDGQRGEFGGGKMPPEGLQRYAELILAHLVGGEQLQVDAAYPRTINGVPALVVPTTVQTSQGPVALSLAVYEGGNGSAYHFVMVSRPSTEPAATVQQLFASFRLISAQEAARLSPRRIKVKEVRAGDTIQSLAAQMATEHPMPHFLTLNGLADGKRLQVGTAVKLVVNTGT